jgi:nitrite reductase/ring-hydroxylating ferredoxin subunit/uncharacterized membrane protein
MTTTLAPDRLEELTALDGPVSAVQAVVHRLPTGRVKDALHGLWLGHPLHPVLAEGAMGAWISASILDLTGGEDASARRLIVAGMVASAPAALAGAVDWADQGPEQMRVGIVHAAVNTLALGLYGASLVARARGHRLKGRALGLAGLTVVGVGGYLGGHMAYRQGAGANHAEDVKNLVKPGWHALGPWSEVPDGKPVRRMVDDVPVFVYRTGQETRVLADKCSHLSGPLSEGTVEDGCVTCPWHGSVFRLTDGAPVHGPATAPMPVFETRVQAGVLEASLRPAD